MGFSQTSRNNFINESLENEQDESDANMASVDFEDKVSKSSRESEEAGETSEAEADKDTGRNGGENDAPSEVEQESLRCMYLGKQKNYLDTKKISEIFRLCS